MCGISFFSFGIGATIRIHWEIQFLLYAVFFPSLHLLLLIPQSTSKSLLFMFVFPLVASLFYTSCKSFLSPSYTSFSSILLLFVLPIFSVPPPLICLAVFTFHLPPHLFFSSFLFPPPLLLETEFPSFQPLSQSLCYSYISFSPLLFLHTIFSYLL